MLGIEEFGHSALASTDLPLPLYARGKVRDIYDLGEALLMVATDRISAFDCILPTPIPGKGQVLTKLSAYWFEATRPIVENHLITTDTDALPSTLLPHRDLLAGRAMLVRKAKPIEVECVVRGYLAGSAWREYTQTREVCGIPLPEGLREGDRLPQPIFTPATKARHGHDENITFVQMAEVVGEKLAQELRELSLALYTFAEGRLRAKGLILADTKFEFGILDGEVILIDELLTPDSSRIWDAEEYRAGRARVGFDKQYVRDYLESIGWDKKPPAPPLPPEVVAATRRLYLECYHRVVGSR
ncbi:MAG: phosphoribosylaminoimidazolesuccinocarboxamide synthase [Armatimonadota bacterium]|nr:phosphoribosylaminoimidazolesuccinocarboxamide synthase [Armatimonadota bacterium]